MTYKFEWWVDWLNWGREKEKELNDRFYELSFIDLYMGHDPETDGYFLQFGLFGVVFNLSIDNTELLKARETRHEQKEIADWAR